MSVASLAAFALAATSPAADQGPTQDELRVCARHIMQTGDVQPTEQTDGLENWMISKVSDVGVSGKNKLSQIVTVNRFGETRYTFQMVMEDIGSIGYSVDLRTSDPHLDAQNSIKPANEESLQLLAQMANELAGTAAQVSVAANLAFDTCMDVKGYEKELDRLKAPQGAPVRVALRGYDFRMA